jgi:hypothetical protein
VPRGRRCELRLDLAICSSVGLGDGSARLSGFVSVVQPLAHPRGGRARTGYSGPLQASPPVDHDPGQLAKTRAAHRAASSDHWLPQNGPSAINRVQQSVFCSERNRRVDPRAVEDAEGAGTWRPPPGYRLRACQRRRRRRVSSFGRVARAHLGQTGFKATGCCGECSRPQRTQLTMKRLPFM